MALLTPRRWLLITGAFALFAAAMIFIAPGFGAQPIRVLPTLHYTFFAPPDPANPLALDAEILLTLRLPRIALAFLVGAALGVVGAVFQALLRNPLADPYTLGVSSGGSLGAVVAIFLPQLGFYWTPLPWLHFSHIQLFAFAGALAAVLMIYLLARGGERVSTMELLLAGVTMSMIFGALILSVRYFAEPHLLKDMDRWMMGGLNVAGWKDVLTVLPFLLPALLVLLSIARGLDQMAFGDELAGARGVNVGRLQRTAFFSASLATGAVVAVSGPIGFVGLIVPHTVRRLIGPDHRLLLPCVFFGAGGFLVLCDTFARTVIAPTELPVGIITALLGGPFFIYLLISGRRRGQLWFGN